ncbi:MAG: FkbM family methyltransferase, partial [Candidatus Micrarchaeota archaeon]|nr:FkbM family methyltransferase [Candidatus Micrarchaeota archaeon]
TIIMIRTEFLGGDKKGGLEVSGKKVVDIGAYVGDTAIFFILEGARHVYAIEPYPHFYNIGKKNAVANGMGSRITMINAAVGKRSSSAKVDAAERNFAGKKLKARKNQKRIRIMNLSEIVGRYKIRDGALKVDCEGHEYEILLGADRETLRKFSHMEIEYHYGYSNIAKKLEGAGFSVRNQGATKRLNFGTRSVMVHGFMQAKRVG